MILIDDHIHDYTPEQIAHWMEELPEWRRRQALAYKFDLGRRQSLLAYRLLCQGLREGYGITELPTFLYGEHGKPHLHPSSFNLHPSPLIPHFSLSHCREAVCCAISDRPVGIDIENTGRKVGDGIVRYSMNEEEQRQIEEAGSLPDGSNESDRTFLRLWTQKEAVAKLLGTGIRDDFKYILAQSDFHIETRESDRWVMSIASHRLGE